MPIFIKLKCNSCDRVFEYSPKHARFSGFFSEIVFVENLKILENPLCDENSKKCLKGIARVPLPSDWMTWGGEVYCPWCDEEKVKKRDEEREKEENKEDGE